MQKMKSTHEHTKFIKQRYNELKDDTFFLENYCYFLIEDGKRDEAKEVVQRLIELQPAEVQWLDLLESLE